MAGPTTNMATVGVIYRTFGRGIVFIYLATVAIVSVACGIVFDRLLVDMPRADAHLHALPRSLKVLCAVMLLDGIALLACSDIRTRRK